MEIIKGFVITLRGKEEHAWCKTVDGSIIDPTSSQYECIFEYIPFIPGDFVRVGTCMNCGKAIEASVDSLDGENKMFDLESGAISEFICSISCEQSLESYYSIKKTPDILVENEN